jgi:sugar-specific transcriptional regulator TrmB
MKQLLEKLGLSEKEASVYVALLELAEDTVQNIARKSGVNRATTYVILEKLMKYGLASQIKKGKKTYFVAEDPRELANILSAQQHELEDRRRLLDDSLNQFTAVYNAKRGKPTVRYYEGEDGLEALDRYGRERLKSETGDILAVSPFDLLDDRFPKRRRASLSERVEAKIKSRVIYTHRDGPIDEAIHAQALREAIFIDKDKLPVSGPISILPWGIKIYQMESAEPYGILIEDEAIARTMRVIFELAWKGAELDQSQDQ